VVTNSRGCVTEKVETLAYFLFPDHCSPSLTCPSVRLSPVASFLTGHQLTAPTLSHTQLAARAGSQRVVVPEHWCLAWIYKEEVGQEHPRASHGCTTL
jgi:hypothetical protein